MQKGGTLPRHDRTNKINQIFNVIGYYTGIFQHQDHVGRFVIDKTYIYYIDPVSRQKVNVHRVNGWRHFAGNESQKTLIVAFRNFVMHRKPVQQSIFEKAIHNDKLNFILTAAKNAGILEG